mmetsp:Transcript_34979/g.84493  ORF Transcript_34979/g.84493 Transcript_34979/m.84493 type:complete len:239 (+) Transcript_34979:886-1602(+)
MIARRQWVIRGWLDDLAGSAFHSQFSTIQVSYFKLKAAKSLHQRNLPFQEEVAPLPLEFKVRLFLNHKMHIPRLRIRVLISLVPKSNFVPVWSSFLNVHLKHLSLFLGLEALALASAAVASTLHLLDHRSHSHDLDLDTLPITSTASPDAKVFVQHLSVNRHLLRNSIVELVQCNLEWCHNILGALLASSTATTPTTEHSREDILCSTTGSTTAFNCLHPTTIVCCPLLPVAEHVVGQ